MKLPVVKAIVRYTADLVNIHKDHKHLMKVCIVITHTHTNTLALPANKLTSSVPKFDLHTPILPFLSFHPQLVFAQHRRIIYKALLFYSAAVVAVHNHHLCVGVNTTSWCGEGGLTDTQAVIVFQKRIEIEVEVSGDIKDVNMRGAR